MPSLILAIALTLAQNAGGVQAPSLVGTWTLTGADLLRPDGTRVPDYGPEPRGLAVFTADGHYSVQIYRAERTRFAANDKLHGTPDEYRDASLGMSAHFGTYTVDADTDTITFHITAASFPNWDGATQVRQFTLHGDELSWRVPARPDGSIPISSFKRIR